MKKFTLALIFCFLSVGLAQAQQKYLITSNSVGIVRLGMTVAKARKLLKGYTIKRISDGDGLALIAITKGRKTLITIYAGEEDAEKPINEKAIIECIYVWDETFKTADGIHPNMSVRDAEKILGKVQEVFMSEIESREFAVFTKKPKGLLFRVDVNSEGEYPFAGDYAKGKRHSETYTPNAFIISIQVSNYFD